MAGLDLSKAKTTRSNTRPQKKTVGKKEAADQKKFWEKDISLFPETFSDKDKEMLYMELSNMLEAGVDVRSALSLSVEHIGKKHRDKIQSILDKVIEGSALHEAMTDAPHFSAYECFSIQIGEETGQLARVLKELGDFYSKKIKQKRMITSALSYPVVILMTSMGAVGFMLYFIVPMFSEIFKRFGGDLPAVTQMIISFSEALSENIYTILLVVISLISFVTIFKSKPWFKKYLDLIVYKIPFIGALLHKIQLARFCSSLALLLSSKVPLLQSIGLIAKMIEYYPIHNSLSKIEEDILQGLPLNESMKKIDVFDGKMVALIKVGEEVNRLDSFFAKLANNYGEEADHQTSMLGTFIEPVMIVVLGGLVGFILVAMYLPMFKLSTNIGF
ncbi:type II secretion system F family protein [Aureibacter tunicatorum]|uniref:Type IV pilus assembly protein PilC n=1 Tax=Aureibacter tunicatorum TaxID=866807 RepID=A0AAE3XPL8_9BACT|nr:type II secretion system F family protein [Aureibacter tunicatorum]MDR6241731.1 type IV pilus assembly protein PilC [Aureibacter tunicatorum]BDD07407.1 general secretion pathway protein GspF [Aureibacter tunicatorum]